MGARAGECGSAPPRKRCCQHHQQHLWGVAACHPTDGTTEGICNPCWPPTLGQCSPHTPGRQQHWWHLQELPCLPPPGSRHCHCTPATTMPPQPPWARVVHAAMAWTKLLSPAPCCQSPLPLQAVSNGSVGWICPLSCMLPTPGFKLFKTNILIIW